MSWGIPNATGIYPMACHDILDKVGLKSSLFRIYYPTDPFRECADNCPIWMDSNYLGGLAGFLGNGMGSSIFKWYFKQRRVPVLQDGPLVMPEGASKLPLVLISHGLGLTKNTYSYISCELASHGFFVVSVDHRDGSACASLYIEPDSSGLIKKFLPFQGGKPGSAESAQIAKKNVSQRVEEMSKVMDNIEALNNGMLQNILSPDFQLKQFQDKINTDKCCVMGHSFGGATAIASLVTDGRFKVGVAMDPWMVILEDKYFKTKADRPLIFINAIGVLEKLDIIKMRLLDPEVTDILSERKMVTILGSTHLTQSDFAFFPKTKFLAKLISRGSVDPLLANQLNLKLMLGFIQKHFNLPQTYHVGDIIKDNAQVLMNGSNIEVDESEITQAKTSLKAESEIN